MKQISLIALLAFLLFSAAAIWRLSSLENYQLTGTLVHRVDTTESVIALTFDDGPVPGQTEAILHILADEQIPATFFLLGQDVKRHPQLLAKILAAGHQVGNHSYSHQRMIFKTPAFIASEIEHTDALLKAAGVPEPILFRPPYGKKLWLLPSYLAQHHRISVTWDLAPENLPALLADRQKMIAYTVQQAKPGSIILLHVMYQHRAQTLAAVPDIIRGLKQRGFRFVTVAELMTLASNTAQSN
jgi:peptidoglycan/xylan/chitin deacetylase (PgdA/CDA1 family)